MHTSSIKSHFFVRNALLGSAAALAIFPSSAMAQSAPAAGEESGEVIVVTGSRPIAESEAAALLIQKNSD